MLYWIANRWSTSSWEYIRRFGRSPIFSSIVLYPIVASLITIHGNLLEFPIIGIALSMTTYQSVKVYLLYSSLLMLFIGSSVYAFRCPEFIKRYENSLAYIAAEIDVIVIGAPGREVLKLVKKRYMNHHSSIGLLHPTSCSRLKEALLDAEEAFKQDKALSREAAAELMVAHWLFMARSWPRSRTVIVMLYWSAGVLIGINAGLSVFEIIGGISLW